MPSPRRRPGANGARGRRPSTRAAPRWHRWRSPTGLAVLVAVLALLPYLNAVRAGFAFDDFPVIVRNPHVMGTEPLLGLLTRSDRADPSLYRPVTLLTYALNARLGVGEAGFHLVNVLLHAGVAVLVARLVHALLGSLALAAGAGALFAVHPVHTEAVSAIAGRAELLAALFGLLALLATVRAARAGGGPRAGWSLASAAAFLLAVLSKESGVTVLPLALVVALWVGSPPRGRRALAVLLPHAAALAAYLAWRTWLVGALTIAALPQFVDNPLAHVTTPVRLATAAVVLGQYLGLLALPITLSSDYSYNQVPLVASVLDVRLLVTLAILASLAAGLALFVRRAPALGLAAAFLVLPLALTANVLFPIGTIKAERLLYLPSLGWCLAAAWLVLRLGRVHRVVPLVVAGVLVVALAGRTWARNPDWKDRATVHAVAVRTAPMSAKAHYNWANELVRQKRWSEAVPHFARSADLYPMAAPVRWNFGAALALTGRVDEAVRELREAVRLEPGRVEMRRSLADLLVQQGRLAEAVVELEAAVRLAPAAVPTRQTLGLLLVQLGRFGEAAEHFAAVVRQAPRHADAENGWGLALLGLGRPAEAVAHFEAALAINPGHAEAQANLRRARGTRG